MQISVRKWEKNNGAVSVDYGPLTFSLEIGERWVNYGRNKEWPETQVFPTTPWNYGLVLDEKDPAKSFTFLKKTGALAAQPFTTEAAPVKLFVKAQKIRSWKQDKQGLVGKLQASPARSWEPVETVTLVPMGAARLRITAFPVIGKGKQAHEWKAEGVETGKLGTGK
jgi:hypothetical protein